MSAFLRLLRGLFRLAHPVSSGGHDRAAPRERDWYPRVNTPSELDQLVSQFTGTRVRPNYKEEAVVNDLNTATASILLIVHLIRKTTGRDGKTKEVEGLFDFSKTGLIDDPELFSTLRNARRRRHRSTLAV